MFDVALLEPEIPPNTGNIIRLCANAGAKLHLIGPLGFALDHRQLRRAGLDYHELAAVQSHTSFAAFLAAHPERRIFACSTRGAVRYSECRFDRGDTLLFGSETRGLPETVLNAGRVQQVLRIPMCAGNRSINLSNAVAIVLFEAWRQQRFAGAGD